MVMFFVFEFAILVRKTHSYYPYNVRQMHFGTEKCNFTEAGRQPEKRPEFVQLNSPGTHVRLAAGAGRRAAPRGRGRRGGPARGLRPIVVAGCDQL